MERKILSIALVALLTAGAISGCKKAFDDSSDDNSNTSGSSSSSQGVANNSQTVDEVAEDTKEDESDYVFNVSTANKIIGKTSSVAVEGSGATASGSVATINASGDYIVEGDLTDGQIVVDVQDNTDEGTVKLILNGADFSCSTAAALYVKSAAKVSVLISDGTENTFSSTYSGEDSVATIHSKQDLYISGGDAATGTLTVNAKSFEAIKSTDGLIINSGTITATSNNDDAIQGKDFVQIRGGVITATGGKHAIKSTSTKADKGYIYITGGTFKLKAEKDGIHGVGTVQIKNGTFGISTSDDGIGSESYITIDGGTFNQISCTGNGINTDGAVEINGGTFVITNCNKCIAAEGNITINDGDFTLTPSVVAESSNNNSFGGPGFGGGMMEQSYTGHGITVKKNDNTGLRTGNVTINGGNINITNSYEGIQGVVVTFNGGVTRIVAKDDAVNASNGGGSSSTACHLIINGGLLVTSSTGDGVDSNGYMSFNGGITLVSQNSSNNEPLDAGDRMSVEIYGGVVVAVGSRGMASAPTVKSSSTSAAFLGNFSGSANTWLAVNDADGNNVLAWKVPQSYQLVKFSDDNCEAGSYTFYSNATVSGSQYVDGIDFYYPATSVSGNTTSTVTLTKGQCTTSGGSNGGFQPPF